jgi:hypothetical protein
MSPEIVEGRNPAGREETVIPRIFMQKNVLPKPGHDIQRHNWFFRARRPGSSGGVWIMVKYFFILILAGGLTGCASLSVDQKAELDAFAEINLREMKKAYPAVEDKLADCKGYMALDARHAKIPFVGWGSGKGVVVDTTTGERTYVKVSRLDVGGGGGIRDFDVLIIIYDEKLMRYAKTGKRKFGLGAEASAGTSSIEGSGSQLQTDKGYEMFSRSERGASATWTLHAIRIKPYKE